ncbi:MAG: GGDEF domain-containing protein [Gammaproteobacteria bacterium]|nr:GGDEF domain-containing protein [Gammaproteobacteria bacterium]
MHRCDADWVIDDYVPIGILVLDGEHRVCSWNRWLENKTDISAERAKGCRLEDLFPTLKNQRFDWALEQVIAHKSPQVMSQALNHFLIPIPTMHSVRHGLSMMQQHVTITPLIHDDATLAVVAIIDVTDNIARSSAMLEATQQLQHESYHDQLTQLYNRRFMWEWLVHELKQCMRYEYTLACMMIDIDHFKRLNDDYGHDKGDVALEEFAKLLSIQFRDSDILVRYGGEEFAAFMPYCDLMQACAKAERIQAVLRSTNIAELDVGYVTCSIGVGVYAPANPVTGEELLKAADKQLYRAKNSGRNCVMPGKRK